ncbi:MAG: hypothetical protein KBF82_00755 [Chitinophagaceae bacterium]|nr:hypothetical protein [Chitinophagaceae bacterium]MBP9102362.1 hypothetical protein [Chitinophagaceae bacterium]
MTRFSIFILTISFISCKGHTQKTSSNEVVKDPTTVIQENEKKSSEKQVDDLGDLITTVSFKVKTKNKKDFEDGFIPWASIESPEEDIPNLYQKNEIVIKDTIVYVIIDYPLTNEYRFVLTSQKGFTREQLLREISINYYKIYEEEEKTATIKTIPIDKRTIMYNRNTTNGKYGIWGHDIADLLLSEILVYKTRDGQIILSLSIES